jgi:hypothetical protein
MNETSRRQILRGMAGASMLPALSFLKPSTALGTLRTLGEKTDSTTHSQTLAVVFHGLFAFLFGNQGDSVEIIVPAVKGHQYWAGNFGQEDENKLRRGKSFQLLGVNPGNWSKNFDFPFLTNLSRPHHLGIHCKITIPWPDCLMFDRHIARPKTGEDFFESPPNLKPSQVPTIYAFLYYDTTIASRPELTGTCWKAPRIMGQHTKPIDANLHIRAEHCWGSNSSGRDSNPNGWDTFSNLFGLRGSDRLVLNKGCVDVDAAKGIGTTVLPSEDNFLADENQCGGHSEKIVNSPTNCASIGGCKPGMVC